LLSLRLWTRSSRTSLRSSCRSVLSFKPDRRSISRTCNSSPLPQRRSRNISARARDESSSANRFVFILRVYTTQLRGLSTHFFCVAYGKNVEDFPTTIQKTKSPFPFKNRLSFNQKHIRSPNCLLHSPLDRKSLGASRKGKT
jgi:hypothetical protein